MSGLSSLARRLDDVLSDSIGAPAGAARVGGELIGGLLDGALGDVIAESVQPYFVDDIEIGLTEAETERLIRRLEAFR